MNLAPPRVLALDLEGTLISNAASQIPRPGLYEFLASCQQLFQRIVIFTTVSEAKFRPIAKLLVQEGLAPAWFAQVEYVNWSGTTKDLSFIPGAGPEETLLVDDYDIYVHPGQEGRWVQAPFFDYPYPSTDTGLAQVVGTLRERVTAE
jgi:hypothetical protein